MMCIPLPPSTPATNHTRIGAARTQAAHAAAFMAWAARTCGVCDESAKEELRGIVVLPASSGIQSALLRAQNIKCAGKKVKTRVCILGM